MKSAGLTVGNGAACFLLRRTPWPNGGIRLRSFETYTAPKHWNLCQAPIDGTFVSSSVELMRLGKLIPPWLREILAAVGWTPQDVDHFVFHQPNEVMVRRIIEDTGADPSKGVYSHPIYGNTASASVGMAFDHLLRERAVRPGGISLSLAVPPQAFRWLPRWVSGPLRNTRLRCVSGRRRNGTGQRE